MLVYVNMILKRISSTIIAGVNTLRRMFAWTDAGKGILYDEFNVVFDEDDDHDESESEVKNLTAIETECLREEG